MTQPHKPNIVLIGFPGVGKSSIGKLVAERLALPFVDTDEEIVRQEGRPITHIFRESGEPFFRELERGVIRQVSQLEGAVISTGGGSVLDPGNVELLGQHGHLIYLTATPEAVYERLKDQTDRPLLLAQTRWELAEKIRQLMRRRAFDYIQSTNVIDVTCLDREDVADRIIRIYRGELRICLYGLVGGNLERTLSPLMHNAAFNHHRLPCLYHCFETDDLQAVVARVRRLRIAGFNVTFPYKQTILPLLDELTPEARAIGAANTITNQNGRLTGSNTDAPGAVRYLRAVLQRKAPGFALAGARAVVIGYGGAGRAVAYGLMQAGCRLTLAGRRAEAAAEAAGSLGASHIPLQQLNCAEFDLLVNATPVGMGELQDETPISCAALRPGMIVYDLVYSPLETRLLREAAASGCIAVDGLGMLLHQGALSYQQWTGRRAPRYLMERVIKRYLANPQTVSPRLVKHRDAERD